MDDIENWVNNARDQLAEVRGLLDDIKIRVRAKQVNGQEMPPELLLLMGNLKQQESRIWWGARVLDGAESTSGCLQENTIKKEVNDFKETYTRAMNLLTGVDQYLS